jgi:hypothetical protein
MGSHPVYRTSDTRRSKRKTMRVSPLRFDITLAQPSFDFFHAVGEIGVCTISLVSSPGRIRLASGGIIGFPVWFRLRGVLGTSWLSAEFQAQHKPFPSMPGILE